MFIRGNFVAVGKTTNFVIVIAQLYVNEKQCGIHPFLVQLRSLEDHTPLPGFRDFQIFVDRSQTSGYFVQVFRLGTSVPSSATIAMIMVSYA